jgi:type II secretory pathway pseudopilin PulG
LIELLVGIAVIAMMATVAVMNVRSGQRNARIKGAARNVFAVIRNARSRALVTQIPVIVTYDNVKDGEEWSADIKVESKQLFHSSGAPVGTLSGYPLPEAVAEAFEPAAESAGKDGDEEDRTDDPFTISYEVVRGVCVKAVIEDDQAAGASAGTGRSRISVFSTADYLKKKFSSSGAEEKSSVSEASKSDVPAVEAADTGKPDPLSVVWETNGRTDPHRVWVYADGASPESGIQIVVDRFGAAKTLEGDERE